MGVLFLATILALVVGITGTAAFAAPATDEPQSIDMTGAVCGQGQVKFEIDSQSYEYTDGSATVSGDANSVSWAAAPGYTVIKVCIKIGGPGGGSTWTFGPGNGSAGPFAYGISHVVVTTGPLPPPEDVCPNIRGDQAEVPEGMIIDREGNCVPEEPQPPTDVCPNIRGDQAEVPEGMIIDREGNCVPEEPQPPTDVCPNIRGDQAEVPEGMIIDREGNCVPEEPQPPTDVCPNIRGDQAEVPEGMVIDEDGNCVPEVRPPSGPSQPSCPTCGPHEDEVVLPNTVFKAWYGITTCHVCGFELQMTSEVRVVIIGQDWEGFYILDEGVTHDSLGRLGLDGVFYNDVASIPQSDGWMNMDAEGNRISADILPRDNHVACGLSVGYQDTDAAGTAYWHNGHSTWEWQYWLTKEGFFDRSEWNGDALDWVLELRADGTNQLPTR